MEKELFDLLGLGVPFYLGAATYAFSPGSIATHRTKPQRSSARGFKGDPKINRTSAT
jgi:hypothetical protein